MRGLYLVTPNWDDTERLLQVTEAGLRGGAVLVQYRHKEADAALRFEQAGALLALCRRHRTPLVINDHLALCLALDADGLHLGGADGDLALAVKAAQAGASYVAFGGFYPSPVKRYDFVTQPDVLVTARAAMKLPLVVIGGMTPANAAPLVARGASMVAVITSVYGAGDPEGAARVLTGLF